MPPQQGVNLTEAIAWTQRQLVFQRRPLGEVAEEFNRYNAGRIEIRSPALRAQEVTGTFRSDDVASFVAVLAGIPGVKVAERRRRRLPRHVGRPGHAAAR